MKTGVTEDLLQETTGHSPPQLWEQMKKKFYKTDSLTPAVIQRDIFIFSKLKNSQNHKLCNVEQMKSGIMELLLIPKNEFLWRFQHWHEEHNGCVCNEGVCSEG
jgi:hypothetical protein